MPIDRTHLEKQQNLFVRLLFCDDTLARYKDDPQSVAKAFGLDTDVIDTLPDPDGRQMRAERHGRKMAVLSEIRRNYPNGYPALETRDDFTIERFLSSDEFYDPAAALPHPYGVGQGYENSSKFFFWVRRVLGLDDPGVDPQLRLMVFGDFASYLVGQASGGAHDYYRRFGQGVFWRETPGTDLPLLYMTAERHFFRYTLDAQRAELDRQGSADLDALAPEARPPRINIR